MSSYFISLDERSIGSAVKFVGNPPATRWVAYSVHEERRRGFPTLRAAQAWLLATHEEVELAKMSGKGGSPA